MVISGGCIRCINGVIYSGGLIVFGVAASGFSSGGSVVRGDVGGSGGGGCSCSSCIISCI